MVNGSFLVSIFFDFKLIMQLDFNWFSNRYLNWFSDRYRTDGCKGKRRKVSAEGGTGGFAFGCCLSG